MKLLMLNRPAATSDELVAALKEAGYSDVSTWTLSTVKADLWNTCRVLIESFAGKVPLSADDIVRAEGNVG
jgi:hypothetical protein